MTFGTIPASIVSWRGLLCLWRLTASAPFSAHWHSLGPKNGISYFTATERFSRAASFDRGKQNGGVSKHLTFELVRLNRSRSHKATVSGPLKNCQADDFRAREVQGVNDAFRTKNNARCSLMLS
jgi:hypothetical protein